MKIHKDKTKKKLPLIIGLVLLILSVFVGLYLYIQAQHSYLNNTDSSHSSDKEQSRNLKENPNEKEQYHNTDKPSKPQEIDEVTKKQKVQLEASTDMSNDTLFIRGGIDYPVAGGRCFVILTGPSGQSITKDTQLLQGPASTDCQTISVPISELTAGKWSLVLHYESETYTGASANVAFSI